MSAKHILTIILFAVGFIGGKYAWDKLFSESEIVSFEDSDWGRKQILGVRFESPFDLSETEVDLPNSIKQYIKIMKTYQYDAQALSLFISRVEYNDGIVTDIDGAVNGAVQNMKASKGVSDFTYDVKPITKNFLTGRLLQGTCKIKGKEAEFVGELYKKDSKLLQILSMNLSHEENREARGRIMKSMKITL
jgi:hypothetical protein